MPSAGAHPESLCGCRGSPLLQNLKRVLFEELPLIPNLQNILISDKILILWVADVCLKMFS